VPYHPAVFCHTIVELLMFKKTIESAEGKIRITLEAEKPELLDHLHELIKKTLAEEASRRIAELAREVDLAPIIHCAEQPLPQNADAMATTNASPDPRLADIARRIVELIRYSTLTGTQTHKSQTALIRSLEPREMSVVTSLVNKEINPPPPSTQPKSGKGR
jgi:hypothetical protein